MGVLHNRRLIKALAILSTLLFLLVFSSIFFTYTILNGQLKRQLTDTNMELLRQLDHKLELTLKNIDKTTIQLLRMNEVTRFFDYELNERERQNNSFRITNLISSTISGNDSIFSIDLYSYAQERLVSGNVLTEQDMQQDFRWVPQFEQYAKFSNWMTTRKITLNRSNSPVYQNAVTLVRTYPLIHSPGMRKGAVAVNVKEDLLYGLIRNQEEADRGETFVIDQEGIVVLHGDKTKLGKDISEYPYIRQIMEATDSNGTLTAEVEQTASSIFHVRAEYPNWTIVRVVPDVQLNRPLILIRNTLLALAMLLFVVASVLAVMIGRWTYKPVNRFIHSMTKRLTVSARTPGSRKYTDDFQYFESTVQDILQEREQLNRQVNESKPLIKWQLMTQLLTHHHHNTETLTPYMYMLGLKLHTGHYVVMSVEFDNRSEIPTARDLHLYTYALCNVAEELMNAESQGLAAEMDNGKIAVIMSFEDADDPKRHMLRAVAVADLMKDFVQEYFNRTITIGIGDMVSGVQGISASYKQSVEALSYKLVMGGNSIITQEDLVGGESPQFYRLLAMTDGMVDSVKLLDAERMELQVHRWFACFAEQNVPPEMIVQLIIQCLMKAATAAAEIGVEETEWFPELQLHDALSRYEQVGQLERFTVQSLTSLIERIKSLRNKRERNQAVDQVLVYIHEHYHRSDLSLNLLASEFRLSVSHLSKLFKEHTECNFIDYLMDLRMGKAKEQLAETEALIREIAEQVGYTNVNSFVRIFKKTTGLTPSEYRERIQTKRV
jgi:AraC-like DNA-binding protein